MSLAAVCVFLRKIPFLGGVLDWLAAKRRLFIEYLLLGMFIAFAGLSFALWLTRKEVKQELAETTSQLEGVKGRLTTVEFANETQAQTIDNLRTLRKADSEALTGLLDEFEGLSKNNRAVRNKLTELEKSNEAVRNLRNQPLPPELGCVLEPRACQTRD